MKALLSNTTLRQFKPADRPYEVRDTRLKGLLLRVQPSGVMTWYVEWARGQRQSLGRADAVKIDAAREWAREILAKHYAGEDPKAERRAAKVHTFRSFVDDVYSPWAESNIKTHKATLARLRASFPDLQEKSLADVTPWLIEKWRSAKLKAGAKASTVNRDLDDLRSALAKAVTWELLTSNPAAGVKRSRLDHGATVRFLSDDEEERLRAALDERETRIRAERRRANEWRRARDYDLLPNLDATAFADHLKPLVLLSINTGLRQGEAFGLQWSDLDLDRAMLTVRGSNAKSGRTRHIPLNDEAVGALRGWRKQAADGSGLVFIGRFGGELNNVRKAWEGVLKAARIEAFRWHDMRHHFASRLVMAGVDLNTVRELLGHAGVQMTLRYAHLAPEHKAAAVARLVRA